MNRTSAQVLLALSLAGCCFGGRPGTPPPPSGTGTGTAPVVGGGATLVAGFADQFLSGTAGGVMPAAALGPDCRGTFPATPNHVFTLPAALPMLRFTVQSSSDMTMAVRSPSGQVFCNDDTNGLNPEIATSFPAGNVEVYVGMYSGPAGTPYTMTVSSTPGAFAPPPTAVIPSVPTTFGPGGIPSNCGMSVPVYGPIVVGSSVVLGGHTPYTGPDGQGGFVTDDTNWAPEMGQYVGQRTIVTALANLDNAGCPVIQVAADNGGFYWRIRNVSF